MTTHRSLSELAPGETATILRLGGERPFRRRLMELGLLPGTAVRVINVAPLGDPLEIEVRACRLSIRAAEAAEIETDAEPERRHLEVVA